MTLEINSRIGLDLKYKRFGMCINLRFLKFLFFLLSFHNSNHWFLSLFVQVRTGYPLNIQFWLHGSSNPLWLFWVTNICFLFKWSVFIGLIWGEWMDTVFVVVIMGSSYKTGVAPRTQIRVMFDFIKWGVIVHWFIVTIHCCVLCDATQGSLSLGISNITPHIVTLKDCFYDQHYAISRATHCVL